MHSIDSKAYSSLGTWILDVPHQGTHVPAPQRRNNKARSMVTLRVSGGDYSLRLELEGSPLRGVCNDQFLFLASLALVLSQFTRQHIGYLVPSKKPIHPYYPGEPSILPWRACCTP